MAATFEHTKAESLLQLWSANGSGESLGAGEAIGATLTVWRAMLEDLVAQQTQAAAGSKAKRRKTGKRTKK